MSTRIDQLLNIADAISRGDVPKFQHNECFTSGAFDLLLINLRGAEAFELLSEVCRRFKSLKASGSTLTGYYSLLPQLARQSNTTEMPSGMAEIINEHPELSDELKQWYRLGA